MADKPIFALDAKRQWPLAYDDLQWIVQYRSPSGRTRGVAFIATFEEILLQVLREIGIPLTEEAVNRLDDLPSMIREFIADLRKPVAFQ